MKPGESEGLPPEQEGAPGQEAGAGTEAEVDSGGQFDPMTGDPETGASR